jgi:CRP-like cAMP-binding protein
MLAITESSNSYDFQAMTNVVTYRVSQKEVLKFLEKESEIYKNLVKRILIGFDGLLGSLPYLLSGNSISRVAAALFILERRFGEKTKEGTVLIIKIRHEDLAGMAALSRETVSLAVGELVRKKIIQQKNRFFVIKRPNELKNMARMEIIQ